MSGAPSRLAVLAPHCARIVRRPSLLANRSVMTREDKGGCLRSCGRWCWSLLDAQSRDEKFDQVTRVVARVAARPNAEIPDTAE